MNKSTLTILLILLLFCIQGLAQPMEFRTDHFSLSVSRYGRLVKMTNTATGIDYLAEKIPAPLIRIRCDTTWEMPSVADYEPEKGIITLSFSHCGIIAEIIVSEKKSHLVFELFSLKPAGKVNAVCWGNYPIRIGQTIGEVIGVVSDEDYAIGLQALNVKTLGGELKNAEGSEDMRGSVAVKADHGSNIQAYSLDRSKPRKQDVWCEYYPHFPDMPVKPIYNETPAGSKIALFGCPANLVLKHIGEIELAEGLPHPMIDGTWIKESPETGRAYLISDFNETNIDTLLEYTRKAGLMSLYHEGPFRSWGHYILDSARFPHGNAGMSQCAEKARKMGLRLGVHTLTTFINTNDPYVTPVPDTRLALTGSTVLTAGIDAIARDIPVATNEYFNNTKANTLYAVRIGNEIIRYREVSSEAPYILSDCQRGAFGTVAASHVKGATADKLMDYPYEVFFPDYSLQQEIAGNLASFFNETGVSHMDFDGHEGCYSTGEGDFAMQAFADKVFRETRHTLVNGTSRSSHYYWHICHYWNWGEPWYGGFRESQSDYRIDNQPLLERNYMPNMLGWFLLSPATTQEDIEWMMARAAGYNAGFALVARLRSLRINPATEQLLGLISLWQDASRKKIFSPGQIKRLKDPSNDFHLEKDHLGWKLFPFTKYRFSHEQVELQPGQPVISEWEFENKDAEQPLAFTLTIMGNDGGTTHEGKDGNKPSGETITNLRIQLDGYLPMEFPGAYKEGNSLVCDGSKIKLYDEKGRYKQDVEFSQSIPVLTAGKHRIKFNCTFPDNSLLKTRFIIKTISQPELIPES